MTKRTHEDLPKPARRRLALRAVLRPALTATCLVVVYFVMPLNGQFTVETAVALGAGLLLLVAIIAWQARAITRSAYPRLRAIETIATCVPLFLLLFAAGYFLMADTDSAAFSEPLTRTDALYFTITMFSTVGFGDIVPRSQPARIVTMVQMLGDLLVVGLVARILLDAVRRGLARQARDAAEDDDQHP